MAANKLWELDYALQDIYEGIVQAGLIADAISGARPGRAADPEHGDPGEAACEGWPLMNRLCDALVYLNTVLQDIREDPELVNAIEAERADDDELEARADAASY